MHNRTIGSIPFKSSRELEAERAEVEQWPDSPEKRVTLERIDWELELVRPQVFPGICLVPNDLRV